MIAHATFFDRRNPVLSGNALSDVEVRIVEASSGVLCNSDRQTV